MIWDRNYQALITFSLSTIYALDFKQENNTDGNGS
jgi:hypothetical protein